MPYADKEEGRRHKHQYYLAHREEHNEKAKIKYLLHRAEIMARSKKRYEEHKEEILEQGKRRYQKNKEKINKANRLWQLKNPQKVKENKAHYRKTHREKLRADSRAYTKTHRKRANELRRIRRSNPIEIIREKLWSQFKMTLEDYQQLIAGQRNKCGICKREFCKRQKGARQTSLDPCIDHDHQTKKVRGILCRACNSGLGGLKDSPELLIKAHQWLCGIRKKEEIVSEISIQIPRGRGYVLKSAYGLSKEQYIGMLKEQGNKCGICEKKFGEGRIQINVDHDHQTGKTRGLLCDLCNRSIGLLQDNPDIIISALNWVKGVPCENS